MLRRLPTLFKLSLLLLCAFPLLPVQLLLALLRNTLLLLHLPLPVDILLTLVLRSLPILIKLRLLPLCAFPLFSAQLLTALVGDTFLFVSLAV